MTRPPPRLTFFPYTTLFRSRRPFTLANSSYDFGGDPRAQAVAAADLTPANHYYHQHINHNGLTSTTYKLAQTVTATRSEEHTSELQSLRHLVCRLLLEKKKI